MIHLQARRCTVLASGTSHLYVPQPLLQYFIILVVELQVVRNLQIWADSLVPVTPERAAADNTPYLVHVQGVIRFHVQFVRVHQEADTIEHTVVWFVATPAKT
eukprot:SAG11_NODE_459_length_9261_cov_7.747463_12_plen_103_part_00